jgi:hypothetical protein
MEWAYKMKFEVGIAYRVTFWDHSCGIDGPIKCEVYGKCIYQTDHYIVLSHWVCLSDDRQVVEDNYEYTTLVKACMISRKALR